MPAKKVTKTTKSKAPSFSKKSEITTTISTPSSTNRLRNFSLDRRLIILVLIIGLVLLVYYKKSWFVAATVNGQPITTAQVNARMNQLYRNKTVTQMVNEAVLEQEAAKNHVVVTDKQVNDKISQTEKQYGGADSLNALLAQQGLTRADLIDQTRIQLLVEGLYSKEASPAAADIDKYMQDNKDTPEATDAATFRQTAIDQLTQQNLQNLFSQKFQQLKNAAKIQTF